MQRLKPPGADIHGARNHLRQPHGRTQPAGDLVYERAEVVRLANALGRPCSKSNKLSMHALYSVNAVSLFCERADADKAVAHPPNLPASTPWGRLIRAENGTM